MAALAAALPCRLCAAEFEVMDKLTADGYTLLKTSADVSGWAFSVGGSSFSVLNGKIGIGTSAPQALLHVSSAPGVSGNLLVISTAASNVIRMTGNGYVYANKFYGSFSGATGTPPGDNLGNHTATTALNMGPYAVTGSSNVSAAYYQVMGTTVMAMPGTSNLFVGPGAGASNTSGSWNVFIGSMSGYGSTSGSNSVSVGVQAGGGTRNTFAGYTAGNSVTSGSDIVGIGAQSGYFNTIGGYNTYGGYRSGYLNVNGSSNTCLGYQACLNARGSANTALGSEALAAIAGAATVSSNTVMGYRAGYNLATGGSDNIFIGFQAGYNVTTGSGNIILGYDQRGAPADKMKLNIGGLIYGDLNATNGMRVGISTGSPAAKLEIAETDASQAYSLKVGTSPSSYMLVVATSGNVGIGLASPLWPLHVYSRKSAADGLAVQSAYVRPVYAKAAPSYSMMGLYAGSGAFHASGTLADTRGLSSIVKNMGAGTVTNAIAHYTRSCNNNILSTTTGTYPLYIADSVETGVITNDYGLYQADTLAKNYFAGPVKLGNWTYADSMFDVLANTGNAYSLRVGTGTSPSHLIVSTSAAAGLNSAPTAARLTIKDAAGAEFVRFSNSTTPDSSGLFSGSGTPEGAISAQLGSLYSDYSGGKVYYKKSNDGASTGWEELLQPSTSVPRASMRLTSGVSVPGWTQLPFNAVDYGVGPVATNTSEGSITVYQSGYYLLNAYWYHGALTTYDYMAIALFKNNVGVCEGTGWYPPGSAVELSVTASCVEYLDAGDKITTQVVAYTALTTYSGGSTDVQARMSVAMVNPAAIDMSGSGTAGKLAKFTGTKAIGDSIITESSGRIGISSSAPTQALSVAGDINFTGGTIYVSSVPVIVAPSGDTTLKVGRNAAPSLTGSAYNVFIGNNAGYLAAGSAATYNTIVGHNSAYYISSAAAGGSYNTFLGHSSGHYNSRGNYNTCAGLWSCLAGKNSANTMLGYDTGSYGGVANSTCTYSSNTVVGAQAGRNLCTGASDNILVGRNAGYNIVTGSGNIVIGYYQQGAAADKMTLNIGGLIYGSLNGSTRRVGINAASPAAALHVASNGAMKPPVGTTAQRPGSPYNGMLRFNTTESRPEIYTTKWQPLAFSQVCHGGMVSFVGTDVVHTFYGSGTLRCDKPVTAQLLVVGGGGGGGYFYGGGGGGGGVVECASYSIPAGNTTVTVGAGGTVSGTTCGSYSSTVGGNSSFGASVTAYGGGYGGGYGPSASCATATTASAGGSGGGGYGFDMINGPGGSASAGSYPGGCSGYAYAGGDGQASPAYGGGGGGAGGAGSAASAGGSGGPGRASSISGTSLYYGAGGGGNAGVGVTGGAIRVWFSGRPGFGSGSGADIWGGGSGGSGVVIIRYAGKAQN